MTNPQTDKEVMGEPPSILLTNFTKQFCDALKADDFESAAIAIRNCIIATYHEQIKPLDYTKDD